MKQEPKGEEKVVEEAEEEVEETEEKPPLKIEEEEEVEEVEKVVEPPKVVEERPRTYRIGSHVVQEFVAEGQEVTWVRCVICGAEAPLTKIAELKERPCKGEAEARKEGAVETVSRVKEVEGEGTVKRVCEFCGGEAYDKYPAPGAGEIMEIWLCRRCLDKYEEFYLRARPSLTVRRGFKASTVRGKHPMELGGLPRPRVAWVNELSTWFIESEDKKWPCPACGEKFNRLADVIKHFVEKHPEKPGWERGYVEGVGYAPKTWQGWFCPNCGLFLESEDELREHYWSHRGEK